MPTLEEQVNDLITVSSGLTDTINNKVSDIEGAAIQSSTDIQTTATAAVAGAIATNTNAITDLITGADIDVSAAITSLTAQGNAFFANPSSTSMLWNKWQGTTGVGSPQYKIVMTIDPSTTDTSYDGAMITGVIHDHTGNWADNIGSHSNFDIQYRHIATATAGVTKEWKLRQDTELRYVSLALKEDTVAGVTHLVMKFNAAHRKATVLWTPIEKTSMNLIAGSNTDITAAESGWTHKASPLYSNLLYQNWQYDNTSGAYENKWCKLIDFGEHNSYDYMTFDLEMISDLNWNRMQSTYKVSVNSTGNWNFGEGVVTTEGDASEGVNVTLINGTGADNFYYHGNKGFFVQRGNLWSGGIRVSNIQYSSASTNRVQDARHN